MKGGRRRARIESVEAKRPGRVVFIYGGDAQSLDEVTRLLTALVDRQRAGEAS